MIKNKNMNENLVKYLKDPKREINETIVNVKRVIEDYTNLLKEVQAINKLQESMLQLYEDGKIQSNAQV